VFGDAPAAARYAGINVRAVIFMVLMLSGAIAGLAGASEVAGRAHRLDPTGLAVGFGYAGIIVAALARYHPLLVVPVAFLVGGLANAANSLQTIPGMSLPSSISLVLQGALLIFVLGAEIFLTYRLVWRRDAKAGRSQEGLPE
jgi:simple sugar transport system permease protein